MRLAIVAAPLTALVGFTVWPLGLASADEGDVWAVDRQNVNIRSGPSTNTDIIMTINPGEEIVEIAAKGDWLFVEFPNRNKRGWIFSPLLTEPGSVKVNAAPAPAPAPKAPEAPAVSTAAVSPAAENSGGPALAKAATRSAAIGTDGAQAAVQPEATTQAAAVPLNDEPAAVKSFRETVSDLNDRAVSVAGIELFNDVRSTGGGGVQVLATETWARVPEAGQSSYMNALFERWQSVANGLGPLSLQIVDPNGQVMMERSGS
ncbi:MAG: SH3 domain-containing protein [Pseudomonadota bacterium]